MSVLGHVIGEVVCTVASHLANGRAAEPGSVAAVGRLCREAGFAAGNPSGNVLTLAVATPTGRRAATLVCGETAVGIVVFSAFDRPPARVQSGLLTHLLVRNAKADAGGWFLAEHEDTGHVRFGLRATAHLPGLRAGYLKFVLDSLAGEADDFDARLRAAGLL